MRLDDFAVVENGQRQAGQMMKDELARNRVVNGIAGRGGHADHGK
ncbi:MAG TPA: hypothetical protein VGM54_06105 [Chthoniobacter sp.]